MNVLKNIRGFFRGSKSPETHKRSENVVTIGDAWGGEEIVGDFGMKLAAVYRCVDIVSGTVASLALTPRRWQGGRDKGYFKIDTFSKLYTLLTLKPNSRLNAFDFMKNLVSLTLLHGNAYVFPLYGDNGLKELILLAPNTVSYERESNKYHISDTLNGVVGTYGSDEIIHIKNVSLDGGYMGVSTIYFASQILKIGQSTDRQQADTFAKGSTPRGLISGDDTLTKGFGAPQDDQLEDVSRRIEKEMYGGKRIMFLPGTMRYTQMQLSPADLKILESKNLNILEICRFFGVHPDKVFMRENSNYKASENSQTTFLTDTLAPMLKRIELEFTVKLIPEKLLSFQKIQFSLDDYYQTDLKTKSEYIEKTIQTGLYTVNDWRRKEGKEPVQGGDTPLVSCNVAPLDSVKIKGEPTTTKK